MKRTYEMVDRYDPKLGISAMMRTTGYSLSITGQMQARRRDAGGGVLRRTRRCRVMRYIAELAKRGIVIEQGS